MKANKIIQWIILSLLMTWGLLSFMVLAGDEDPTRPAMSLTKFFALKAGSALSLYLCYVLAKWLNKKGFIPEVSDDDNEFFK